MVTLTPETKFMRCVGDRFMQVRNERAELLGCIPMPTGHVTGLRDQDGTPYEIRYGAVPMLCVPNNRVPKLDGFVPLDLGENADLAEPPQVTEP